MKTIDNWRYVIRDGKHLLVMTCPDCGEEGDLSEHKVNENGTLDASIVCGMSQCNFHHYVRLVGWKLNRWVKEE